MKKKTVIFIALACLAVLIIVFSIIPVRKPVKKTLPSKKVTVQTPIVRPRTAESRRKGNVFSVPTAAECPKYFELSFSDPIPGKKGLSLEELRIKIVPEPINYRIEKVSDNMIRIFFDEGLKQGTAYEVGFDGSVLDRWVAPLFAVKDIYHSAGDRAEITMQFNYDVSSERIAEYLSFSDGNGKPLPFKVVTKGISRDISVLLPGIADDTEVNALLKNGLPDAYGMNVMDLKKHINADEYKKTIMVRYVKFRLFVDRVLKDDRTNAVNIKFYEDNTDKLFKKKREIRKAQYVVPDIETELLRKFIDISPRINFGITKSKGIYKLIGKFKAGEEYSVTVRKGLTSNAGCFLSESRTEKVKFPNENPSVGFFSHSHIILKGTEKNIALKHMNNSGARLYIRQIYQQNIIFWLASEYRDNAHSKISDIIYDTKIALDNIKNVETVSTIDLEAVLKDRQGVFNVAVVGDQGGSDVIQVIVSDLGITAKKAGEYIDVWVRSLTKQSPKSGIVVTAYSYSNNVLERMTTDWEGNARFKADKVYALIAEDGDDLNYMVFDEPLLDASKFDVAGTNYKNTFEYKAYVYTDRGVYRPNDTANITIMVRDSERRSPKEKIPVKIRLVSPRNTVLIDTSKTVNDAGMADLSCEFGNTPATGQYVVNVLAGKNLIGQGRFSVEEFVPETIKIDLKPEKMLFMDKEDIRVDLKAEYLFGAPAAEASFSLDVTLKPIALKVKDFSDYSFGKYFFDEPAGTNVDNFTGELGADGSYALKFNLDNYGIAVNSPVQLKLYANVSPPGTARGSKRSAVVTVMPGNMLIGLKADSDRAYRGKEMTVKGILLDTDETVIKSKVTLNVEISRVEYSWYYYYEDDEDYGWGAWRWQPYSYNTLETSVITGEDGTFEYSFVPDDYWGGYIMRVSSEDRRSVSEYFIPAQWEWRYYRYSYRESQYRNYKDPEYIKLFTDKEAYDLGDTAKISFNSKFSGTVQFSAETDKVIFSKWYALKEGRNEITCKISEDVPNIYFHAHLIKEYPQDLTDGYEPEHCMGIKSVRVIPEKYSSPIEINAPEKIKPNTEFEVSVETPNIKEGWATISVVDEGILQITNFISPDPFAFFFQKCALGVSTFDNYGWVSSVYKNDKKPGGGVNELEDQRERELKKRVTPVKLVSYYSGIVKIENGKASVKVRIPYFNGTLRIMAVAAGKSRMASAEKKTVAADDIVIMPVFPRFLTVMDKAVIPVEITNLSGKKAEIGLVLSAGENIRITPLDGNNCILEDKKSKTFKFSAEVLAIAGTAKFKIALEAGAFSSGDSQDIPIIPPTNEITVTRKIEIQKGKNDISEYFSGWAPGYESSTINAGSFMLANTFSGIKSLIRYPYGCIEQTTSSTMPLLYIKDVLKVIDPDTLKKYNIDDMVAKGIARVLSMQTSSGGFSYWPGGNSPCDWGTAYATHMLLEAKKAGYPVSQFAIENALGYLMDTVINSRNSAQSHPYALFVLALAEKDVLKRIMNAIDSVKKGNSNLYHYSEDMLLLSAAAVMLGKKDFFDSYLSDLLERDIQDIRDMRDTFWSSLRFRALRVYILSDLLSGEKKLGELAGELATFYSARSHYTTQEMAWSIMAAGKILRKTRIPDMSKAEMLVNGKAYDGHNSPLGKSFQFQGLSGENVVLNSPAKTDAVISITGYPVSFPEADSYKGIRVNLKFFDSNGMIVNLKNLKVGDLIFVELEIGSDVGTNLHNMAVTVRIPAGFEIENPRLTGAGALNWMDAPWSVDHMDIRDDKIQLFGTLSPWVKNQKFYFTARVAFSGEFIMPGTTAEAMYDPSIYFRGGIRKINIRQ